MSETISDPLPARRDVRGPRHPDTRVEVWLSWAFAAALLARLLFPFYSSPLDHVFSDSKTHWQEGINFFHPDMMGGSDLFLYQLWLYLLQQAADGSSAFILTGCGLLCAAMPYGWYRAFRELLPKPWALAGALVIAAVPEFTAIYAYFMTETLVLTLTGLAFWLTFRARRRRTVGAFAFACLAWLAAMFTRIQAAPMALVCLLALWLPQSQKGLKAAVGVALLLAFAVPSGLHARLGLQYFAPFGNLYINQIYAKSGMHDFTVDFGGQEYWTFGSPAFYNPTFYPFSYWTTDRVGTFNMIIDPAQGSVSWAAEDERAAREDQFPAWKAFRDNALYLLLGQVWPNNDMSTVSGWLSVWSRWLWPIVFAAVAFGAVKRWFHGYDWLLPTCALGMLLFFVVQQGAVMEGRYRTPIDPVFVASAVVMTQRYALKRQSRPLDGDGTRKAAAAFAELGVGAAILHVWRDVLGRLDIGEARRVKALEDENLRLKRLLTDLDLQKSALEDALRRRK